MRCRRSKIQFQSWEGLEYISCSGSWSVSHCQNVCNKVNVLVQSDFVKGPRNGIWYLRFGRKDLKIRFRNDSNLQIYPIPYCNAVCADLLNDVQKLKSRVHVPEGINVKIQTVPKLEPQLDLRKCVLMTGNAGCQKLEQVMLVIDTGKNFRRKGVVKF